MQGMDQQLDTAGGCMHVISANKAVRKILFSPVVTSEYNNHTLVPMYGNREPKHLISQHLSHTFILEKNIKQSCMLVIIIFQPNLILLKRACLQLATYVIQFKHFATSSYMLILIVFLYAGHAATILKLHVHCLMKGAKTLILKGTAHACSRFDISCTYTYIILFWFTNMVKVV